MLIVITGNGKGKTTSAIGQAIRAMGHNKRIFFAQFIKCDNYPSGEDSILRSFGDQLTFIKGGKGFVGILGDTLPIEEHRLAAAKTLSAATRAARKGHYELIVLDEINVAISLRLISPEDALTFLDAVPESCDVVFTGRHADNNILARAEFVTECIEIKHPFRNKIPAKKGVEY